jgi:CO dehydrogenase/acetyl-CoA synthase gamma subunit (corrinoid Fe-S protein)
MELRDQVIDVIKILEGGGKVNSYTFAQLASKALNKKVNVTNCIPCLKQSIKELKSWLELTKPIIEEPIIEPPIEEQKKPSNGRSRKK